jgi:ribonuclease E
MNQTEALVSIDVNSGRSTREHSIEDTALQTNLEAADEVARQLRLRDLAGLIVIDFIDMEEKRNNRAVEKKLKECLKNDRARIQVGRISHFGLLEMSRQRIRASVLESTTQICSHCGGTGHVRSQSSVALHVLRGIEEYLLKNTTHDIVVRTTPDIALYLLNHKRQTITDYESRFGVSIVIGADNAVGTQHFAIDRGEPVANPVKIESLFNFAAIPEDDDDDIVIEADEDEDEELEEKAASVEQQPAARSENNDGNRKRKRRRRRRGRSGDAQTASESTSDTSMEDGDEDGDEGDEDDNVGNTEISAVSGSDDAQQKRKRRRRGKRGGRRNRDGEGNELAAGDEAGSDEGADHQDDGESDVAVTVAEIVVAEGEAAVEGQPAMAAVETASVVTEDVKPAKSRSRRKPKAEASPVAAPVVEAAPATDTEAETVAEIVADLDRPVEPEPAAAAESETAVAKPARANRESNVSSSEPVVKSTRTNEGGDGDGDPTKPKKAGWWQRRGFF